MEVSNKQSSVDKEFVPYEQALALKELGFDEPCYKYIYIGDTGINVDHYLEVVPSKARNYNEDSLCISQLTFSQAFRFFREKHNIHSYIDELKKYNKKLVYDFVIVSDDDEDYEDNRRWKTYEEAQLGCLKELIEIVKEQTQ